MKSEITISELAKLMNVSVHQIRYFEEKGVLPPAYTDDNQYRMYGIDQVYRLAHILMLRKLGLPVQTVKEYLTSYSPDQYRRLLHHSLREVEAELQRLKELQRFIQKVLYEQTSFSSQPDQYQIKRREAAYLERWMEMDSSAKITAALLAEQAKRVPNLFELDIHYLYDGSSTVALYLEAQPPGDYFLPEGDYLSIQTLVNDEEELEHRIAPFYDYAASQSYVITGPLVLIEKSYLSLFSNGKLHYELQALIEPAANSKKEKR